MSVERALTAYRRVSGVIVTGVPPPAALCLASVSAILTRLATGPHRAARSSIPVELDLRIPAELPPEIEAAAYYVCAEAVTNTVKPARASKVWLDISYEGGMLRVEVRDDGIGGACIDCDGDATGLGGLRDRVEALGGALEVVSPAGEGTRLVAAFPALVEEP